MNPEKLKALQEGVRIGGKGTARRKKKVVHRTAATDERKLNTTLKKLGMNAIPGIEEVNMFKDDGQVIHFTNPKVQALLPANSFAVTGHGETKPLTELLPNVLAQLGSDGISGLKQLAESLSPAARAKAAAAAAEDDDDEVPELTENFDEAAKNDS